MFVSILVYAYRFVCIYILYFYIYILFIYIYIQYLHMFAHDARAYLKHLDLSVDLGDLVPSFSYLRNIKPLVMLKRSNPLEMLTVARLI